jgi:DNA (cytosine-5)-methyltransferase 1
MLTAIDLFSGCGGLSEGLKMAGFDVLAAFELDPKAIATYQLNHPEVALIEGDVTQVDVKELRELMGMLPGTLDLLAGCPPCQGYSSLRTRNGGKRNRDSKNGLVREMLRFAEEFLPKAIMMENVPGLEGKAALRDLVRGLEALEYDVSIDVKNAKEFGVPQRRRRLILLAGKKFKIKFAMVSQTVVTVRDAIANLAPAGTSGDPLHDMPENRSESVRKLISLIPQDGGSRSALGKDGQL